jgi:amidase
MARRVGDLRLAFGCMCGPSPLDPWHAPSPAEGAPIERPIHVSLVTEPAGSQVHPDVSEALRRAAQALEDAGYVVEPREPPALERASQLYFQILSRFGQPEPARRITDQLAGKDYRRFREAVGPAFEAAEGEASIDAFGERLAIARAWGELQAERPLVLAPVANVPAFEVGFDLQADEIPGWIRAMPMILVVNLLGLPAVALPTHVSDGLPQGVQIIGPRFREDLCLAAAEAVEERLGGITPIE